MLRTLKYIGLGLIAAVLLALNVNMVYKTFFAKNRLDPDLKKPVEVTNEDIRRYADSVFVHRDSLRIVEDDILSNKRIIIENADTVGFAFVVYEPISCPSCSDVNYMLITDTNYIIKNIKYLRDIVEDYKTISEENFKYIIEQVIGKNVLQDSLTVSFLDKAPKKQAKGFSQSIFGLQSRVIFLNEK